MPSAERQADIVTVRRGDVLQIILNRPEKKNALKLAMWEQFPALIAHAAEDDQIRVIVLRGAGNDFSAGADISEFAELRATPEQVNRYANAVTDAERALAGSSKPVIAQIAGYCLGGGLELALACDFRMGDTRTRAGIPAAKVGVVYSAYSTRRLAAAVGFSFAKHMMYTACTVNASQALETGLLDAVCADDEIDGRVAEFTDQLAARSTYTIRAAKLVLESGITGSRFDGERFNKIADAALDSDYYKKAMTRF